MSKERFKVTIKDQITGEKTTFYAHSAGYTINYVPRNFPVGPSMVDERPQCVRLVMDYPRFKKKVKRGKS